MNYLHVNKVSRQRIANLNHSHPVGEAGERANVFVRGLFLVRDVLVNGVDNVKGSDSSYWQRAVDTITVSKDDVKNPLLDDCSIAINKVGIGIWQRAMRYWNEFSYDANVVDETRQRISQRTAKFLATDSVVGEKEMGDAVLANVLATKLGNSLRYKVKVNPIGVATGKDDSQRHKLVVDEVKENKYAAIHYNNTELYYNISKRCNHISNGRNKLQNKLQSDDETSRAALYDEQQNVAYDKPTLNPPSVPTINPAVSSLLASNQIYCNVTQTKYNTSTTNSNKNQMNTNMNTITNADPTHVHSKQICLYWQGTATYLKLCVPFPVRQNLTQSYIKRFSNHIKLVGLSSWYLKTVTVFSQVLFSMKLIMWLCVFVRVKMTAKLDYVRI